MPGFRIVHAWFPPDAVLSRHAHDRTNVMVMVRGSFDLDMRSRTMSCQVATIAVEPSGEPHANRLGSAGAEVMVIQPDPDAPDAWWPFRDGLETVRLARDEVALATAHRLAREMEAPDDLAPMAQHALAIELLVAAHRRTRADGTREPPWLDRLAERLREEPAPPDLGALAAEVGHHPVHVARAFRRRFGASIGTWTRHRRLERAADRLSGSDDSIAVIAIESGFADQSHLTRVFRRHFGTTPAAYRRQRRDDRRPRDLS